MLSNDNKSSMRRLLNWRTDSVFRSLNPKVALKAVPKATTTLRDFLMEFHYSYFLSPHKNILDTYDVAFETAEHYYFAQEVAPFGDLWQVSNP